MFFIFFVNLDFESSCERRRSPFGDVTLVCWVASVLFESNVDTKDFLASKFLCCGTYVFLARSQITAPLPISLLQLSHVTTMKGMIAAHDLERKVNDVVKHLDRGYVVKVRVSSYNEMLSSGGNDSL